jgi:hypothetical protein
MSADYQNTKNKSKVDAYIEILEDLKVSYNIVLKVKISIPYGMLGEKNYNLRKLVFENYVVYEKIIRNSSYPCIDDEILSFKFKKEEDPLNWQWEETKVWNEETESGEEEYEEYNDIPW